MIDEYTLEDKKCLSCGSEVKIYGMCREYYRCTKCKTKFDRVMILEKTISKLLNKQTKAL
jgi:tRNA(Ile2) C34 agmatinyltransferase TiaS